MSNELKLLEYWIPFGFFNDTQDLTTELNIATVAQMMNTLQYPPIDGLELGVLLIVCGVKYFKDTNLVPNAQNLYDALVAYHTTSVQYDTENKQQWVNNFLTEYKNNINQQ